MFQMRGRERGDLEGRVDGFDAYREGVVAEIFDAVDRYSPRRGDEEKGERRLSLITFLSLLSPILS